MANITITPTKLLALLSAAFVAGKNDVPDKQYKAIAKETVRQMSETTKPTKRK